MTFKYYLSGAVGLCIMLASCSDDPQVQCEDPTNVPVENDEIAYTSSLGLTSVEIQTVRSNNDFAWDLFGELSKDDSQNIVISPLSVSIAMTMMANGAYEGSEVQKEILDVLGYSECKISDVNSATSKLADGIYRLDEEIELALANSLWVNTTKLIVNAAYLEILKKDFSVESFEINKNSYASDVNTWCKTKTKGMIDQLVVPGSEGPDMSLINATYFKGLWSKGEQFDKALTLDGDFYGSDGTKYSAKFMNAQRRYHSRTTDKFEMITIPFGKGSYNFQIIRPNDDATLQDCLKALSSGKLNELMMSIPSVAFLDIKLPKFDIEYGNTINSLLADMGMQKAIHTTDYYFAFPRGLKITNILHKAHFKIDEEGAEAAAVTGIDIDTTTPGEENGPESEKLRPFYLDHPFIYLITEKDSGAIIFIGCMKSM